MVLWKRQQFSISLEVSFKTSLQTPLNFRPKLLKLLRPMLRSSKEPQNKNNDYRVNGGLWIDLLKNEQFKVPDSKAVLSGFVKKIKIFVVTKIINL